MTKRGAGSETETELNNKNASRVGMTLNGDEGEQIVIGYNVLEEFMHN